MMKGRKKERKKAGYYGPNIFIIEKLFIKNHSGLSARDFDPDTLYFFVLLFGVEFYLEEERAGVYHSNRRIYSRVAFFHIQCRDGYL
jgi:hypothetical protein